MEKITPEKKYKVMTRDQVRSVDQWAINQLGIPGVVLMENAGRSCAELAAGVLQGISKPKVCILCGKGNNGGDGYVIARHLLNRGFDVKTVLLGQKQQIKGDAKTNLNILEKMGAEVETIDLKRTNTAETLKEIFSETDMIVDAVFGTGLQGSVKDEYSQIFNLVNEAGKDVLAVDIPSGLDCDTGSPLGNAVKADNTVTFVALKKGFAENETARQYTGQIYVASIGIEPKDRF